MSTKFSMFTSFLVGWVVLVNLGYDLQHDHFNWGRGLLMCAILSLVSLSIGRFTLRLMAKPLQNLAAGMKKVQQCRLEKIEVSPTGDEIQFVGEVFNETIQTLKERDRQIAEHREKLEAHIEQRTEELRETMQRALEASQAKSEFLANMSHELRTPMNGILGMLDVVLDSPLTAEQRDELETAQRCAHSLLALLNEILDLSKIERGKMKFEWIPMQLRAIVEEAAKARQTQARQKRLDLSVVIDTEVVGTVYGDPTRFRQILDNLLSNAIKFTESGFVRVSLNVSSSAMNGVAEYELVVQDSGVGIPLDKLEQIFDKFTQADSSVTRRFGGTGLGLAITRRLVETFGGHIGVKSVEGEGSLFCVRIPFETAERQNYDAEETGGEAHESRENLQRLRILLVEDNIVNQKVVMAILSKLGLQVEIAVNGLESLAALRRKRFDLVLMDLQIPLMDGIEAPRKIREELRLVNLPIIAITAHAMKGDRERCLKAGMNDYLAKPMDSSTLVQTILDCLDRAASAPIDKSWTRELSGLEGQPNEGMLFLFTRRAPERISRIQKAIGRNDRAAVERELRNLSEAARQISALSVVESTQRMLEHVRSLATEDLNSSLLALESQIVRLSQQNMGSESSEVGRGGLRTC
ncbi:MAG: ATP-binding protein [Acidobacteriota bacterium]